MRQLRERLKLLKSENPGSRLASLIAGVLAYAQSRLTPLQFAQFQARCSGMGLPISPDDAFAVRGMDGLQAMKSLIWGTLSEVSSSNVHEYALHLQFTLGVAAGLEAGDVDMDGVLSSLDTLDVGALLRVVGSLSAASGVLSGDLTVGESMAQGAGVPIDGGFVSDHAIGGGGLGVNTYLTKGEAEDDTAASEAVLYESAGRGILWKKITTGSGVKRVGLGQPMIDTGWLDYFPAYRGDPSVPADAVANAGWPQQKRWKLDITGTANLVGSSNCPLEVQVFTRKPPVIEDIDGSFGFGAGVRSIDKVHPAASWCGASLFAIHGCLPLLTFLAGKIRLIVMPGIFGGNIDGIEDWYQLRLMLWHRGML